MKALFNCFIIFCVSLTYIGAVKHNEESKEFTKLFTGSFFTEDKVTRSFKKVSMKSLLDTNSIVEPDTIIYTITSDSPIKFKPKDHGYYKDVCLKADSLIDINHDSLEYNYSKKEWFPYTGLYVKDNEQDKEYKNWVYDYGTIPYTYRDLIVYTNINYRESTGNGNVNEIIDKYLVAISGIRRVTSGYKNQEYKTLNDVIEKGGFTKEDAIPHLDDPNWIDCYQVVKKVINCNVPYYVPYLPQGTFYYWNSRIDTRTAQKRRLENKATLVASTIKDHHFFALIEELSPVELYYLSLGLSCSPVEKYGSKQISDGVLCKYMYNKKSVRLRYRRNIRCKLAEFLENK